MIATVYNFKGGVGKTSISVNLSLTLGWKVYSNDYYCPLEDVLPEGRFKKYEPNEEIQPYLGKDNLIFDFGGQIDFRIIPAILQSNFVLIPLINETIDIKVTLSTIEAIREINDNIVIIINRTQGNDFQQAKSQILEHYNYPLFEIKKSRAMADIFKTRKSIQTMVAGGGLKRFNYSSIDSQFQKIIKHIIVNR
jgi:cellulose biosynthesis protein BcsQ